MIEIIDIEMLRQLSKEELIEYCLRVGEEIFNQIYSKNVFYILSELLSEKDFYELNRCVCITYSGTIDRESMVRHNVEVVLSVIFKNRVKELVKYRELKVTDDTSVDEIVQNRRERDMLEYLGHKIPQFLIDGLLLKRLIYLKRYLDNFETARTKVQYVFDHNEDQDSIDQILLTDYIFLLNF